MTLRSTRFPRHYISTLQHRVWLCALAASFSLTGCSSLGLPSPSAYIPPVPLMSSAGRDAPVGSAQWWKHNQKKAELIPGKGYAVAGYEGFFDGKGRPIDRPVDHATPDEEAPSKGLLADFAPNKTYRNMREAVGLGPDRQIAEQAFAKGESQYAEKRYAKAAKSFKEAADRWPNSQLEQDSLFMMAECYFFNDKYIKARDTYDLVVSKYSNTPHLDQIVEREWQIARYWEEYQENSPDWPLTPNVYDETRPWFDTIGHSIKTYDNIRLNDPTGPRADDAILATANIYFQRGRFDDADYHYTLLRREYPKSEHQFEAHLLGLQAKLRKYQGPDYDGTPLEEAKKLVRQLDVQFAQKLSTEERERLKVVEADLNRQVAQRDYQLAEYYDGKKQFAAARYYYAELAKEYPQSELAEAARERLAQIADKPANPPERLSWLIQYVPQSAEKTRVASLPEIKDLDRRLAEQRQSSDAGRTAVVPASTTQ